MLVVNRKELLKAAQFAAKVAAKRNTMPILANVRVSAGPNGLELFATDLEIMVNQRVRFQHAAQTWTNRICVNAKQLVDAVKLSTTETTTFEVYPDKLSVNGAFLIGISAEEFPIHIPDTVSPVMALNSERMTTLIDQTIDAVSDDATRYHLNGILFETNGTDWQAIATDGHRMHVVGDIATPTQSFILPAIGAKLLPAWLKDSGQLVSMRVSQSMVTLIDSDVDWIAIRTIEGKYPNWRQLIPAKLQKSATLKVKPTLDALKRIKPFCNKKSNGTRWTFTPNRIELCNMGPFSPVKSKVISEESAKARYLKDCERYDLEMKSFTKVSEVLESPHGIESLMVGFNGSYIVDALSALDEPSVTVNLNDQLSPILIKSGEFKAVVMPMRI